MKYGIIFILFAILLFYSAFLINNIFSVLIIWLSIDFLISALGYLYLGSKIYGKNENGRIKFINKIVFLPFFIILNSIWYLANLISKEDKYNYITDNLVIGRRLLQSEIPQEFLNEVTNYIDLTSEFTDPKSIIKEKNYILLPILDGDIPDREKLKIALNKIKEGKTYIHCAQGHGRTGLFTIIYLVKKLGFKDYNEVSNLLNIKRPKLKLNKKQVDFVKDYLEQL